MRFRIVLALIALLVLGPTGVAAAQTETGDLVFVHGDPDAPAADLVIYPFGKDEGDEGTGRVAVQPGTTAPAVPLPVGEHVIEVYLGDTGEDPLYDYFTIAAGATTTISAVPDGDYTALHISQPVLPPPPSPSASPIRTPSRVETGAGGATDDGVPAMAMLAMVAGLATAGVVAVACRRSA